MGSTDHLNATRTSVYFHYFPSTVSNWDMAHFGQLYQANNFIKYNFNSEEKNIQAYGQPTSPQYPLENMNNKNNYTIFLFRGSTDGFISTNDAEILIARLRDEAGVTVQDHLIQDSQWNHLDFIIGQGAGRLVYDQTLAILDQFNNE